jgi:hypothetical protein
VSLVSESFKVFAQYLLPKQALTAFAGWVASRQRGRVTTALIRWFVGKYQVNMAEAANPDIGSYLSFNDFFTRALRPGVRPLADATLICPVDGAISQFGAIEGEQIFQAKGHQYSTTALVGGDAALAAQFHGGSFATLYLSPRDYHRIHMPCDGRLQQMVYVPGDLFSVNPVTARGVPGLPLPAIDPHQPCMIQYTSGTTGQPKGALLNHYSVTNNARMMALKSFNCVKCSAPHSSVKDLQVTFGNSCLKTCKGEHF